MISIGCKKHPRYQAKSEREPKCYTCFELWQLKRVAQGLDSEPAKMSVFPDELRIT